MAIEDWAAGSYDDYENYHGDVTCKRCGEEDLYWSMNENGWRLFGQDGNQHFCHSCEPCAEDFSVVQL